METELAVIDPAEFGLDEKKTEAISLAFAPNIEERKLLTKQYAEMLDAEMSRETAIDAGKLRRKLVKVRTGLVKIHKTQKAFFLASGRFVDAYKNKETEPVTQMEEKLLTMENYYLNLEMKRIEELHISRHAEIKPYIDVDNLRNFGEMSLEDYTEYHRRAKKNFDDLKKIREDEIKAEADKKIAEAAEKAKLKKERDKATAEAATEKRKREKAEDDLKKERGAKAKRDLEDQKKEEAIVEAEAVAFDNPDSVKFEMLMRDMEELKTKYTFRVVKNQKTYKNVGKLFDKIATYIMEN